MKNRHFYCNEKKKCTPILIGMSTTLIAIAILLVCHFYMNAILPEKIYMNANEEQTITMPIPGIFSCESSETSAKISNGSEKGSYVIYSETIGQYELQFKLFGLWNYKSILLEVMEETEVIPGGIPVGIYLESNGILVIETAKIMNEKGEECSPCKDLLQTGDYIIEVNGEKVTQKEQLIKMVETSNGEQLKLRIKRGEKILAVEVAPLLDKEQKYKLGAWVRDDTQGIGTITYIEADGSFGALGHGISDADIGVIMECERGTLYEAQIRGIIRGVSGSPGSLSGIICYGSNSVIGSITANTDKGVFGTVNDNLIKKLELEPVEIAYKQEVKQGPATIYSTVDGERKEYDIYIKEVNVYSLNSNKGMVIEIRDEKLIQKTGGIVQGMSGSPIIQNGKMVGAVTHVLVNDPTTGYGIFIENMLDTSLSK